MKVLLADDSGGPESPIKKLLVMAGYDVIEAIDAHEAARRLADEPDVIVCESTAPNLDAFGIPALLTIANARGHRAPVVVASADLDPSRRARAQRLGAFAFVDKPYATSQLVQAVAAAIAHARRRSHRRPKPPFSGRVA